LQEKKMDWLQGFWEKLFSREPAQIEAAWRMLDKVQQKDVRAHLCSMVTELDWDPEQVRSAEAALDVIDRMKPESGKEEQR
jgi:hypothetical protein